MPYCAECAKKFCLRGEDPSNAPKGCPSVGITNEESLSRYTDEEKQHLKNAALVEGRGYGRLTRIEEIMDYSIRCGYKKIGLAFCVGFSNEAATLAKILRKNGFEVESVCCKNGEVPKSAIGVEQKDYLHKERDFEIMCNPAGQAAVLNASDVDLCVILGLCVGHDTVFIKHCEKPVTYAVVKDRALGHNPVAALYCSNNYLQRIYDFRKLHWDDENDR